MKKAKIIIIVINLAIIGFLIWFLWGLDYKKIGDLLAQSNKIYLIIGLLFFALSLLFKITRFGAVTRYYGYKFSFTQTSFIQMVGIAIAMMTPGRLGEATKIYLLKQRQVPVLTGTALTIFERVFDFLFLSLAGLFFVLQFMKGSKLTWGFIALLVVMIGLLIVLRNLHWLTRFVPARFRNIFVNFTSVKAGGQKAQLIPLTLFTILTWSTQAVLSWSVLASLDVHVSPLAVLGVEAIGTLAAILSFLPLGIGAMDLSMLFLYSLLGVGNEPATIAVFISRTVGFLAPLLIALIMTNVAGTSFKEIRAGLSQQKPSA